MSDIGACGWAVILLVIVMIYNLLFNCIQVKNNKLRIEAYKLENAKEQDA